MNVLVTQILPVPAAKLMQTVTTQSIRDFSSSSSARVSWPGFVLGMRHELSHNHVT